MHSSALLWSLLADPITTSDLSQRVAELCDADAEQVERQAATLLDDLVRRGALQVVDR